MDNSSTGNQSILKKMSKRKADHLGAAAGRAVNSILSAIYEAVTNNLIQQELLAKDHLNVLHYLCGTGEDTFLLASLLEENAHITAVDEDKIMIEKALQKSAESSFNQVHFFHTDQLDWRKEAKYDLIFTRLLASNFLAEGPLLKNFYHRLKEGGMLIIEGISLSGYSSYPYNHAFARSTELLFLTYAAKVDAKQMQDQLKKALQKTGFRQAKVTIATPFFIANNYKMIVSLSLEAAMDKIIDLGLSTATELDALLLELRHFENKENTLISSPGMYQMIAKK